MEKVCLYCLSDEEPLYKVQLWDNPKKFNWFCFEHMRQAVAQEQAEKEQFIDYYKSEYHRKWLSPKQLELWEKLSKKRD